MKLSKQYIYKEVILRKFAYFI